MNEIDPNQVEAEQSSTFSSPEEAVAFYNGVRSYLIGHEPLGREGKYDADDESLGRILDNWQFIVESGKTLGADVDIDDFALRSFWDREKNQPYEDSEGIEWTLENLKRIRDLGATEPLLVDTQVIEDLALVLDYDTLLINGISDEAFDYLAASGLDVEKIKQHLLESGDEFDDLSEEKVRERMLRCGVQLKPEEILEKTFPNLSAVLENLDFYASTGMTPQNLADFFLDRVKMMKGNTAQPGETGDWMNQSYRYSRANDLINFVNGLQKNGLDVTIDKEYLTQVKEYEQQRYINERDSSKK